MIDNFELGLSAIPLVSPVLLDRSGQPITGSTTIVAEIRRIGTSDRWDFGDNTFKTSGWTLRQGPLAQVDAGLDAGVYERAAGWVATGVAAGVYLVVYRDTLGLALPASEAFRLGGPAQTVTTNLNATVGSRAAAGDAMALIDNAITSAKIATDAIDADAVKADAVTKIQNGLATDTALATAQGNITSILAFGAPPTAVAISDVVRAGVITDHGAGSYLTASVAGLATATDVTNAALAIIAVIDARTTTILTAISVLPEAPTADAIRIAVWADDDDAPVAGTRRWEIWRMSQWITETNPKKIVGQNLILYTPGLGAVLATILLKDAANDDIEPGAGEPAQYLP